MIKTTTSLFGTLFNDIQIVRVDPTKTKTQVSKVPLMYGSMDKAYVRRTADADTAYNMKTVYPRMAFLMRGISKNDQNVVNPLNRHLAADRTTEMYTPVPYTFEFELSIEAKHLEDGFQIIEQILPFFNPSYTISANTFPQFNLQKDIPVTLNGVSFDDSAPDSDFEEPSINTWTLSFTVNSYIFAPIKPTTVIESISTFTSFDLTFNAVNVEEKVIT